MDLLNLRSNLQKIYSIKIRSGFLSEDPSYDATKEACEFVFIISVGGMIEYDSSQEKTKEPIENLYDHYLRMINEPNFNDQIVAFLTGLNDGGIMVQVWKGVKAYVNEQQRIVPEGLESMFMHYYNLYTLINTFDSSSLQELIL